MAMSANAVPGLPMRYQGSSVQCQVASSASAKAGRVPFVRHGSGDLQYQGASIPCRLACSAAPQASSIHFVRHGSGDLPPSSPSPKASRVPFVRHGSGDLRFQRASISGRPASSTAPQAVSTPFVRHGSGDLPPFQTSPRSCAVGPAQVRKPPGWTVSANRMGGRGATTQFQANPVSPRSPAQKAPPTYMPNKKISQPSLAAKAYASFTLLPHCTSTSSCTAGQDCKIDTSGASHVDGIRSLKHSPSSSTMASGSSTITSAAGSSIIITDDASHLDATSDGADVATVSARASAEMEGLQAVDDEEPDNMKCTIVAFKDNGLPSIWQLENSHTGKVQTFVEREDGSVKAFGDSTMSSIEKADEAKTLKYVDSLQDIDLRGFVHEVGRRVTESIRIFNKKQNELEELLDYIERNFFGIEKDATKNDLDKAYRKLARKMHPDKNGGTEDAKQAFQNMFERYKRLRCKCRESVDEADLATSYVNRIVLRVCKKEEKGVRGFVDRVVAKSFRRALNRETAKHMLVEPDDFPSQAHQTDSERVQPDNCPEEDLAGNSSDVDSNSRSYLENRAKALVRNYKMLTGSLSKINQDLERLHAARKQ